MTYCGNMNMIWMQVKRYNDAKFWNGRNKNHMLNSNYTSVDVCRMETLRNWSHKRLNENDSFVGPLTLLVKRVINLIFIKELGSCHDDRFVEIAKPIKVTRFPSLMRKCLAPHTHSHTHVLKEMAVLVFSLPQYINLPDSNQDLIITVN